FFLFKIGVNSRQSSSTIPADSGAVSPLTQSHVVRFATFELDLRCGELRNRGIKVGLQEKPFQVLALLLASPGELVTRKQLFEKVWSAYPPDDLNRSLAVAINKLRTALNDKASTPRFVETVPRRGRSEEHTSELQSRQYLV